MALLPLTQAELSLWLEKDIQEDQAGPEEREEQLSAEGAELPDQELPAAVGMDQLQEAEVGWPLMPAVLMEGQEEAAVMEDQVLVELPAWEQAEVMLLLEQTGVLEVQLMEEILMLLVALEQLALQVAQLQLLA